MPLDPRYSCHGGSLYRLQRTGSGAVVADEWAAGAWQGVSDLDYVVNRTTPISALAAATFIERQGARGASLPEAI